MEVEKQKVEDSIIVDTIFKELDTYKQSNISQRDEVNDIYNAYIGKMDNVSRLPYKSHETIPKLRTEINYIVPFIFSGTPEFEVEPIGEEDKDFARVIEKIVNFRFDNIPQAYEKIESWVKQSVTFGTSVLKVCWKFATKKNEDGTETPVVDSPEFEVPNILDCFYNPLIPDIENQNSIIFRSVLTVEEVKNNPAYDYTNQEGILNREKVVGGTSISSNQFDSSRQASSDSIDLMKSSEGTVEIYERISKDKIQTVANGKERLLLRDKPYHGFINAVKLTHEPNAIPNRFEGFGVGQNTLGLGKLYYKVVNQTIDSVTLANNPMFLFKKGAVPDKKQLVGKPGGGVEVDTDGPLGDAIVPVLFPDVKQGASNLSAMVDDEHKRASGANDLVQGSASSNTLGQDQLASSYSSNRFELVRRRFKQALSDVATMLVKLEIQSIQSMDSEILRIFPLEAEMGEDGEIEYSREVVYQMLISPEAKNAKYNIKVKGDTTIARNKDVQIKQLTEMFNLFGNILPPENQLEWARKMLQLRGVDEIDKLVPESVENPLEAQSGPIDANSMGGQPTPQAINQETYQ